MENKVPKDNGVTRCRTNYRDRMSSTRQRWVSNLPQYKVDNALSKENVQRRHSGRGDERETESWRANIWNVCAWQTGVRMCARVLCWKENDLKQGATSRDNKTMKCVRRFILDHGTPRTYTLQSAVTYTPSNGNNHLHLTTHNIFLPWTRNNTSLCPHSSERLWYRVYQVLYPVYHVQLHRHWPTVYCVIHSVEWVHETLGNSQFSDYDFLPLSFWNA